MTAQPSPAPQLPVDPDPVNEELTQALAGVHGCRRDRVTVGCGSSAVIAEALALAGPGELVTHTAGFPSLPALAARARLSVRQVPVCSDRQNRLCADAVVEAVTPATTAVLVRSPHSPTGAMFSRPEMERLLDWVPEHVMVILDQADADFQPDDAVEGVALVETWPNLLVTRALSTAWGLAGPPIAFGVGLVASQIDERIALHPISDRTQATAVTALADRGAMRRNVERVRAEQQRLAGRLAEFDVDVRIGGGDFVWVPSPWGTPWLTEMLALQGVEVSCWPGAGVQIPIGTSADSDALIAAWPMEGPSLDHLNGAGIRPGSAFT